MDFLGACFWLMVDGREFLDSMFQATWFHCRPVGVVVF